MRTTRRPPVGPNVIERPRRTWRLAAVALVLVAAACSGSEGADVGDLTGARIEVVGVWQGVEADAFEQVLEQFAADTGAEVTFTSTGGQDIGAVLDHRLEAGDPPDLALLPQPGLIERYARAGHILPIEDVAGDRVRGSWGPEWLRLGSVDGDLYAVWFKAANKSLIWYSLGAFEDAGVVPPSDLDALHDVARSLSARGTPAFSLTGTAADAWTLTDWFENLYLRLSGPERYDALASHRLPWTDPTVESALAAMAELLEEELVIRADGADTSFPESVAAVFSTDPAAAMVMEGDFVPGVVAGSTVAEVGVDVDVVDFPGVLDTDRFVVGGGDAAVLMRSSEGGRALLRYLASTDAAEVWAPLGGFLSPNDDVDLTTYPDPTTRRIARSLLEAGDRFRFDLSDLQPPEFGGTGEGGMAAELTRFLDDPSDIDATMARLEAAADDAWSGP